MKNSVNEYEILSENFKQMLENDLNKEQLKAVLNIDGNFLVLAAAGSGKTRVIIYRTMLLLNLNVPQNEILVVTFTRKAANEIKERVSEFLDSSDIYIETFHSLAYKFLKKFSSNKTFRVITEDDKLELLKNCFNYTNVSKKISKDCMSDIVERNIDKIFESSDLKISSKNDKILIIELIKEYQKLKKEKNLYTFNDLIIEFKKLLNNPLLSKNFQKFKYIMVDEYQDTDSLQVEILKKLCKNSNLMVVGDDYQSIYSFNGSLVTNIVDFQDDFQNVKIIVLSKNYRSSTEILSLTNEVAKSLKYCFRKKLVAGLENNKQPVLNIFRTHDEEIEYIYKKIKDIIEKDKSAKISILFRNYKYMEEFINKFEKYGLKFNITLNPFLENIYKDKTFCDDEKINLMTIHSSKGLEWDYVFIPLLLEGVIPTSIGNNIDIEEERRIFYVAITRAKKELELSYPLSYYNDYGLFTSPSNFIEKINSKFLKIKKYHSKYKTLV